MQRLLLLAYCMQLLTAANAQRRPFFNAYEAGLVVQIDDYSPAPADWNALFKTAWQPPYRTDSMKIAWTGGWSILPELRTGLTAGAQKYLGSLVGSKTPRRIVWTTQLQFTSGFYTSLFYSNNTQPRSDTAAYNVFTTLLKQRRTQVNIYNALDVRFKSFLMRRIEYNIGVGIMAGAGIRNKMNEKITLQPMRWNTQLQVFSSDTLINTGTERPGKNIRHVSLVIPFGATWHVSSRMAIGLVHHYIRMWQAPAYVKAAGSRGRSAVEGYQLHLTVVYKPAVK